MSNEVDIRENDILKLDKQLLPILISVLRINFYIC